LFNLTPELHPVNGRPGWYRTKSDNWRILEARAIELQPKLPKNVQLFCGLLGNQGGHAIYVIEDQSAIEIARQFDVGAHNAFHGPGAAKVCDQLQRIFEIAPFRPYFVDAAGY
jgi:hypothetical protein